MKPRVDVDWWKDLFDETYLLTDARSVCDENLTRMEVDFLIDTLRPGKSAPILDMCGGQGRHSLELSSRGFSNVTVLDYSHCLIELGKQRAEKEELNTSFIKGDARETGLRSKSFHFIIIMASSFGYFADEDENKKILSEAFRLLMSGGVLLLDLPNRNYVLENFKPCSSHRVNDDITVRRDRKLEHDILFSQEIVMSEKKGCIRDKGYLTRLYSREKISSLIYSADFSSVTCTKDFMNRDGKGDFGNMSNRMVVVAKKGAG
ncbi:class I SAM-dependent methyltransferase [Thermodesulfobacteriota bacterium]